MKKTGSFEEKQGGNWLPGLIARTENFLKRKETDAGRVILILFLLWAAVIPNALSGLTITSDQAKDNQKVAAAKQPSALDEEKIAAWLRQLPASDQSQAAKIFGEMLQSIESGVSVVSELAGRLQPPGKGDDTLVRYALDGVVQTAAKNASAGLKGKITSEILAAVASQPETQLKTFLLNEAGYLIEPGQIKLVEPYLLVPELADETVRTLLKIMSPEVEKALLKAWPRAPLSARLSLLQGLGELRSKKAVPLIKPLAVAGDPKVRLMALCPG